MDASSTAADFLFFNSIFIHITYKHIHITLVIIYALGYIIPTEQISQNRLLSVS